MSSSYDQINQLPIWQVLSRLGIEFNSSHRIREWGNITSWRKINSQDNYVNDFSKDRAKGWPFALVKSYLHLSNREAFKWFEEKFWIVDYERKQRKNKNRSSNKSFISYRPY